MNEENPKQSKKRTAMLMASNPDLKDSVSEKLLHLLRDLEYDPDSIRVLTEYVVVLVSNGKCQSEAKAELEPFLGDNTSEFVSWLWDILSETSFESNANMRSSDLENGTDASSTEADDASIKNQPQNCRSGLPKSYDQFQVIPNSLGEETYSKNASPLSCKSNEKYRAFENSKNNQDGSLNGCSFGTKPSAEILPADKQHAQCEKVHEDERSRPSKHSQETNVGGRRLFSRAAGAIFSQKVITGTTRGNVWDRLGTLTKKDTSLKVKKFKVSEGDNIQRQTLEQNSVGLSQNTLMPTVQDNKVNQNLSRNCYVKTYRSSCAQKRKLNDYEASISCRPEKICQEKLSVEALESTQTLISHSALPAATGRVGPLQAQLVDVKLRLRQLETEISKLQTKSVNKYGEHSLSSSFDSVDLLKEGVESRTVLVTNVAIVRVIMLTDTSTIKQKWFKSAYITFTTKESVDKALTLNGAYFFSRIIWVRKAGKIAMKPTCSKNARERKATFQQQHYHDPRLPWQRNYGNDAHRRSHDNKDKETSENVDAEFAT